MLILLSVFFLLVCWWLWLSFLNLFPSLIRLLFFKYQFLHYNKYCSYFSCSAHDIFPLRSIFYCSYHSRIEFFALFPVLRLYLIFCRSLSWPHCISHNKKLYARLSQWYPNINGSAMRWLLSSEEKAAEAPMALKCLYYYKNYVCQVRKLKEISIFFFYFQI